MQFCVDVLKCLPTVLRETMSWDTGDVAGVPRESVRAVDHPRHAASVRRMLSQRGGDPKKHEDG